MNSILEGRISFPMTAMKSRAVSTPTNGSSGVAVEREELPVTAATTVGVEGERVASTKSFAAETIFRTPEVREQSVAMT